MAMEKNRAGGGQASSSRSDSDQGSNKRETKDSSGPSKPKLSRSEALTKARKAAAQKDWKEAAELFVQAEEWLQAATALEKSKSWIEAADAWKKMGAWADAGRCYTKAGEHLQAAEALEKAEKYNYAAESYRLAGYPSKAARLWMMQGDPSKALTLYQQGGDPAGTGQCYAALGQWKDAASHYEEGEKWIEAARCWERVGEHQKAIDDYLKGGDAIGATWAKKRLEMKRGTSGKAAPTKAATPAKRPQPSSLGRLKDKLVSGDKKEDSEDEPEKEEKDALEKSVVPEKELKPAEEEAPKEEATPETEEAPEAEEAPEEVPIQHTKVDDILEEIAHEEEAPPREEESVEVDKIPRKTKLQRLRERLWPVGGQKGAAPEEKEAPEEEVAPDEKEVPEEEAAPEEEEAPEEEVAPNEKEAPEGEAAPEKKEVPEEEAIPEEEEAPDEEAPTEKPPRKGIVDRGRRFEREGSFEEALACYNELDNPAGQARCLEALERYDEAAAAWESAGKWPEAVKRWLREGNAKAIAMAGREPAFAAAVDIDILVLCTFDLAHKPAPKPLSIGKEHYRSLAELVPLVSKDLDTVVKLVHKKVFANWIEGAYPHIDVSGILDTIKDHPLPETLVSHVLRNLFQGGIATPAGLNHLRMLWFVHEQGRAPSRLECFAFAKVRLDAIDRIMDRFLDLVTPLDSMDLDALSSDDARRQDRASVKAARFTRSTGSLPEVVDAVFDLELDIPTARLLRPFIQAALEDTGPLDPTDLPARQRTSLERNVTRLLEVTGGEVTDADLLHVAANLGIGIRTLSRARALVVWAATPPDSATLIPAEGREEKRYDMILAKAAPSDIAAGHIAVGRVALAAGCGIMEAKAAIDHLMALVSEDMSDQLASLTQTRRKAVEQDLRRVLEAQSERGDDPHLGAAVHAGMSVRRANLALAHFFAVRDAPVDVESLDSVELADLERRAMDVVERAMTEKEPLTIAGLFLSGDTNLEQASMVIAYCQWSEIIQ